MFPQDRGSRTRLTALISITLWFCGTLTFADPHFYVRKKIPNHSRNEAPASTVTGNPAVLMPAAPSQPDPAQEKESPSSVSTEMETTAEPEALSDSRADGRKIIPGSPPSVKNGEHLKVTVEKSEKTPKKSVTASKSKEHRVIQSPAPLLPETPLPEAWTKTSAPPARIDPVTPGANAPQPAKPLKASAKRETKPAVSKPLSAPQVAKSPKEKPLVRFPDLSPAEKEALLPTRRKQQPSYTAANYPRRYRPLPTPINARQREWHQEALEAYDLGNMMGRENRLDDAVSAYRKAVKLFPEFADAYVGLSTASLLQSNWEDAFGNAQKGLSLRNGFIDPNNITRAHYNLAATYCAMDNYGKAKQHYGKVEKARYELSPQLWNYLQQHCKH